jgi:uncharacterized protein YjbI with pentapeptide repeats
VDSSVGGYDGAVRDEEHSVWQTKPEREQREETKQSRWGFRGKTVWDWMALLIVPLVLVVIGLLFTMLQDARQQQIEAERAEQAQKIENQRAEAERELAEQRAQDEALQAYLSQMGSLLLEKDLRGSDKGSEVRTLARARTLTVLGRLDPSRKIALMQFLVEADLVQRVDGRDPIISLRGADLSNANLQFAIMPGALLSYANLNDAYLRFADLRYANLRYANLNDAYLGGADLSDANLNRANLRGANLISANLRNADLSLTDPSNANLHFANLRDADLISANLYHADLSDADLRGANLYHADLRGANLRNADLSDAKNLSDAKMEPADVRGMTQQAAILKGATMPNGQKYEDWLKDREKR